MKTIVITGDDLDLHYVTDAHDNKVFEVTVNQATDASDGSHTFEELYEHRYVLWITLCRNLSRKGAEVWCAKQHADGSMYEGWFILGINSIPGIQMSYHLPLSYWDEVSSFATVREQAPEWDGHTSQDVLTRLRNL